MKRIAAIVVAIVFVLMAGLANAGSILDAPKVEVDKLTVGQAYDLFFDAREVLFFSEDHYGLSLALTIWLGNNLTTKDDPIMTIENNTIGHNVDVTYSFDGREPFSINLKGWGNTTFYASSGDSAISTDFLVRFLLPMGYNFDRLDDLINSLKATEEKSPDGTVTYHEKVKSHTYTYRIQPMDDGIIFLHSINIRLGS